MQTVAHEEFLIFEFWFSIGEDRRRSRCVGDGLLQRVIVAVYVQMPNTAVAVEELDAVVLVGV